MSSDMEQKMQFIYDHTLGQPDPFYYGLIPYLWKRLIGWRDEYGRKAKFIGWRP